MTGPSPAELERIAATVRPVLDDRFAARERGITGSRRVIRASANAIRSLHRGEVDEALALLAEAGDLLAAITDGLSEHQDILHAGFVTDAGKEYAEARITASIFAVEPLPTPEDLGVDAVPFLHGLGEAVGECRRRMLDRLRADDLEEAERLLQAMDAIVDLLATMDYPDGMTSGLRRTTDVGRSLVERSRADLTSTVVQNRLRRDLEQRRPG
ncbi:MAG TPA: haloacid dehalogenase [Acidimicrobiia bacterium]|nr:haloacid dehalogenase [Acidimicrobiia bacterium]